MIIIDYLIIVPKPPADVKQIRLSHSAFVFGFVFGFLAFASPILYYVL